jgi:hypothetical protein
MCKFLRNAVFSCQHIRWLLVEFYRLIQKSAKRVMYLLSKAFMLEISGFHYKLLGGEPLMVSAECHKGSFCVYTPKFCQEGYCSGCEIYLKKSLPIQKADRRLGEMLQEILSSRS